MKKTKNIIFGLVAMIGVLVFPGISKAANPVSTGAGAVSAMVFSPSGDTLYVGDADSGKVYPVVISSKSVGSAIVTGAHNLSSLIISPDGSTLYVGDAGSGNVYPIDTTSKTVGSAIVTEAGNTYSMAISPDGNTLYVSDADTGNIYPVDTASTTVGGAIFSGASSITGSLLAMSPDGNTLYVGDYSSNKIYPIDTVSKTVGSAINTGGVSTTSLAISSDGNTLYASDENVANIFPIDTASKTVGSPIATGASESIMSLVMSPDGKTLFACDNGDGKYYPINTTSKTAGSLISTGINILFSIISPDGSTLYMGDHESGDVYLMDVSSNPPFLSGGSPSGMLESGVTSTQLSVTTDESATCKYSTTASIAYSAMTNTFDTTGNTTHTTAVSGLTDGNTYHYYVRCQDQLNNPDVADYEITFSVASPNPGDSTPPVVSNGRPSGNIDNSTGNKLKVATDEPATCKYSTTAGTDFELMTQFATTTGTSHSTPLPELHHNGSYTYYIKCSDANNNVDAADYLVSFHVKKSSSSSSSNGSSSKKETSSRHINNSSSSISRGQILIQSGKGFSKNSSVALYFTRLDGSYYSPQIIRTTSTGSFSVSYRVSKPAGTYKWYVVNVKTGWKSAIKTYTIK